MPLMDKRPDLTVITHARDAEEDLARLLPTVRWATEVVVLDMQSTDTTARVAREAGARVISIPLHPRVDAIRNRYLEEARTEWILVLDADEYLADDAGELVHRLLVEHGANYDAFALPRFNRIGDRILRGSGWYPDHQVRLFRRGCVRWADATHQPPVIVTGSHRLLLLQPPQALHIHHNNYANLREVMERQLRYALQDVYDPNTFDPDQYAAAALEAYAQRHQPEHDGDLSRALALIMAWDKTMRCLIHWDQLPTQPSLESFFTLPVAVTRRDLERELADTRAALADRERQIQALRNTKALRLCRHVDRWLGRIKAGASGG